MDVMMSALNAVKPAVPLAVALATVAFALYAANYVFERRMAARPHNRFRLQLTMLAITVVGMVIVIMASPLSDAQKGQLLSLIGILLSAGVALSSTTFLGNAMAGIMLRVTRSFRIGDFIRVGDHFGRVSERGLFHTEVQTEDRDLVTLPNLFLVTNAVKVVRASGTIISAEVSLGYDVPRSEIEARLIEAGTAAELEEPFVHVLELGDFSVTYRVSGLLPDVKGLISARSRLRKKILDALHAAEIEIVSPNFMNTRALDVAEKLIPQVAKETIDSTAETQAEAVAFDKAEEAESAVKLQERHDRLNVELAELEERVKAAPAGEKEALTRRLEQLKGTRDRLARTVEKKTAELED